MADFPRGNFADYALLEDCPYVDDCIFAPEFMSSDYVRVTQLYCDGAVSRFLFFFSWHYCTTCQILAPRPGIEHMTSALDVQS